MMEVAVMVLIQADLTVFQVLTALNLGAWLLETTAGGGVLPHIYKHVATVTNFLLIAEFCYIIIVLSIGASVIEI